MKRSADYESDNTVIRIRPVMTQPLDKKDKPELAYITMFVGSSGRLVHINNEMISELIEMLQAIEARYITKTE